MTNELFSERYAYRKHADLIYEDAPKQVREGLREVLENCGYQRPSEQRGVICKALRKQPNPRNTMEHPYIEREVHELLYGLEWHEFYYLCRRLARILRRQPEERLTQIFSIFDGKSPTAAFEEQLNALFQEESIGYRMTNGRIEKVGSEEFDEAVAAAVKQLGDPRFEVPLRQFEKALSFRSSMPPDPANAVKEAVNAVEGVFQVIAKMPGTALPTILSNLNPPLPSGLKKLYDGLYGYGSGSEGARHAGVGGHSPEAEEAELIIHAAAAAIRYATKTY